MPSEKSLKIAIEAVMGNWPSSKIAAAIDQAVSEAEKRLLNVARGCTDYGGGHHHDGHMEAYQHGIQTVINALTAAVEDDRNDLQVKVLERIGRSHQ